MSARVRFLSRKWPRRILRGLVGLLLFLLVGTLITRYVLRWRGQSRVAEQVAALDAADPRWHWDEVEFDRMLIPDDENSALLLADLELALVNLGPRPTIVQWPSDRVPPPNVFREPAEMLEVNRVLERYADALEVARAFADKPRGRFPLEFPPDDVVPDLGHLDHLRNAVHLLDMDAEVAGLLNRPTDLRSNIQAMFNVAAALDGEPVLLSQINRIGILTTAVRRVERSLALGVAPGDLKSLQARLLAEARTDFFTPGVRGDRAATERFRRRLEAGELAAVDWPWARDTVASSTAPAGSPPPPSFDTRVMVWASVGTFLPMNFAKYLDLSTQALRAADLPEHEQQAALPRLPKSFSSADMLSSLTDVLYRRSWSAIRALLEGQLRIRAILRCAAVALAVEQYRVRHGRWPATLTEIPKDLLAAVPNDPFDGTPVKFVRRSDGVTVYCIGLDGRDDGGVSEKGRLGSADKDDVSFQLYKPDRRGLRDVPEAAQPAPPE
jgi:hypothetical protein